MGELIIFDSVLLQDEVEYIEGYLAHKWGLSDALDSFHPYKSEKPYYNFGEFAKYGDKQQFEPIVYPFMNALPVHRQNELVSRWSFDEISDGLFDRDIVYDLGPAENTAFLFGNARLEDGRFAKALKLNGDGDYAEVPAFRGLMNSESSSFMAWVKLASTGSGNDFDDGTIFLPVAVLIPMAAYGMM